MKSLLLTTGTLLLLAAVAPAQGKKGEVRAQVPSWVDAGKATVVKIVGQDLSAREVRFDESRIQARVLGVGPYQGKTDRERRRGNTAAEVEVTLPADLKPGLYPFRLLGEGVEPAAGRLLVDVPAPEVSEVEPNGDLRRPMDLPPGPVTVLGKLDGDGADVFRFRMKQGEAWRIEIFAQRLKTDTQLEPVLRLRDGRLAPLRAAVDQGEDCSIQYTAPADGAYLLEVFDGDNRSNGEWGYRLSFRKL